MTKRQRYGGRDGLPIDTGLYTIANNDNNTHTGSSYPIKCQRGQTLVEFALVVSLLLAILFGIMEFGRAWFYSNHLTNSVRAAARYGAVYSTNDEAALKTAVEGYLRDEVAYGAFMDANNIPAGEEGVKVNVVDNDSNTSLSRGDTIEVTVRYNFTVLVGSYFLPFFPFNAERPIIRTASMQYEG